MSARAVFRPIVRSFKRKYSREAAAHVRAGGHAVVWESDHRAILVFAKPKEGHDEDFGLWAVYDMGKYRWKEIPDGALKGLAMTLVPRDCNWIVKRRVERDAIHEGALRKMMLDCTTCAACCQDNEVFLQDEDLKRFRDGGREDLTKPPFSRRQKDGKIILTLLPSSKRCRHLETDNRCGIYAIRPFACSEFPAGSECCLFAREDILKIHDGVPPEEAN
jgi:uncharacterized protein